MESNEDLSSSNGETLPSSTSSPVELTEEHLLGGDSSPRRLRLFKNGCYKDCGKLVLFPRTLEELFRRASDKLEIEAKRIFMLDGVEVDNVLFLRDDESLFVSSGEPYIDPCHADSEVHPCYKSKINHIHCVSKDTWIKLNVGGRHFLTTRATLTKDPESMFARMFSSEDSWSSAVDDKGAYLIDRDPQYFEPILNYLRQGELILNDGVNAKGVLEEARFYGLHALVEELEQMVQSTEKEKTIFPMERDDFMKILFSTPSNCELRCQGINLSGADLSRLDLRYINFKLANLAGCNLAEANLAFSCLERADLSDCILDGANFGGAKMPRANLEGASMVRCNFEYPAGLKANLEGANLKGANLEGSQMSGVNLRVANLRGALMQNCVLRDAILAGADLENCNLTGCDLQGANLRGSNVVGTIFLNITTPLHMVHLM